MSNSALVLMIAAMAVFFLLTLLVAALFHHKKSASQQNVIGSIGTVETHLNPEGAIIVNGELWRARLNEGTANGKTKVRVVGAQAHLLLVEPESDRP